MKNLAEENYGIDLSKTVTPLMIRDAITICFYGAHCEDSALSGEEEMQKEYCQEIVRRSFTDSGGDFEKPTKESILAAMGWLMEFSKSFRNPEVIMKHKEGILRLIEHVQ